MTLDLNPRRAIRLSEGAAPDNPNWVNDGVHVGTLSADRPHRGPLVSKSTAARAAWS
jgi:hypothetical protein